MTADENLPYILSLYKELQKINHTSDKTGVKCDCKILQRGNVFVLDILMKVDKEHQKKRRRFFISMQKQDKDPIWYPSANSSLWFFEAFTRDNDLENNHPLIQLIPGMKYSLVNSKERRQLTTFLKKYCDPDSDTWEDNELTYSKYDLTAHDWKKCTKASEWYHEHQNDDEMQVDNESGSISFYDITNADDILRKRGNNVFSLFQSIKNLK